MANRYSSTPSRKLVLSERTLRTLVDRRKMLKAAGIGALDPRMDASILVQHTAQRERPPGPASRLAGPRQPPAASLADAPNPLLPSAPAPAASPLGPNPLLPAEADMGALRPLQVTRQSR